MTEQTHIFDTITDVRVEQKKKRNKIWMRVGQVVAILFAILLVIFSSPGWQVVTLGAFIISIGLLVIAILSIWKPFIFLLVFSIISGLLLLVFIGTSVILWEVVKEEGKDMATITGGSLCTALVLMIVIGTIAAKRYQHLNAQRSSQ